ncbi:MAG: methylenetetrahydrofolate--tRNA-(uracil(54)-C(5))-methyltransferase (FADH(2)-oxidizing) TrmFO [Ignavibacteriales bacterium]
MDKPSVTVVGGGLAGCEAAYRIAETGLAVRIFEMRPNKNTAAHQTSYLSELVCSNSLKSEDLSTSQGMLKGEMRLLKSLILQCAQRCRVPAGSALAVDRDRLGQMITDAVEHHPLIEVVREEIQEVPKDGAVVIATGPLTSDPLGNSLRKLTGAEYLYFFDAVAPVLAADSIDDSKVYWGARYGKGDDDYLNCPMDETEYNQFYDALIDADSLPVDNVDKGLYFEGCMPIEVMARRGRDTLRFGPMRPVGLPDPKNGRIPYAVVQLRIENFEKTMLSMVGFQTRMKWGEQEKVLRLIPGLDKASFLRLGVMHRNTFINSPQLLYPTLEFRTRPALFFAGQLIGVEGYMESAATGILAGINACRAVQERSSVILPEESMLGSLCRYISDPEKVNFQPMNANFGLLPPLDHRERNKKIRNTLLSERAIHAMSEFSESSN